jgi:hypothetical protein
VSWASTIDGDWLRLRYSHKGEWAEFVIDPPATTVYSSASAGVRSADIAELLLGPVFAAVLAKRGRTCLHGAVVAVNGSVLCLLGVKGSGKSTTSLALIQRGGTLIADDTAVLCEVEDRPGVFVDAARLRIRADAAALVRDPFERLPPRWTCDTPDEKRYLEVPRPPGTPLGEVVDLDCVYFLGSRNGSVEPSIRPLSAVEAFSRLMASRHPAGAVTPGGERRDFEVLARLAGQVPVRELSRPDGLATMDRIVDALLADVAG